MGKIRLAYLVDTLISDKAGTEKQLLNIIERLDRKRFEVTLVCLYLSPWMRASRLPCEVVSLGYRGFLKGNFPLVLQRYLRVLKEKEIDLVQIFFEDSVYLSLLGKALGRPKPSLIVSRRDLGLAGQEPSYHRVYRAVFPFVIRWFDGIATNAQAIQRHLSRWGKVPEERIRVIGNGIAVPGPATSHPPLFREFPAEVWIGIVANLKPVKRIDLLLKAVAYLRDEGVGEGVRVLVLGEGPLKEDLLRLAAELELHSRVHFIGAHDNVNDYLSRIDIGVLCSDSEGLSNAVLEYMACALPVVVTDAGGNRELVDDTNGACVPAGDAEALGRALARLVSSPHLRAAMGARSLEKVREKYTWERIMPEWQSYYLSLHNAVK